MPSLLDTLAAELERPRELSPQVVNHIGGTYGVTRDEVGDFLVSTLSNLEDYEIDLILSPVFTPGLPDQAIFAEQLGMDGIPPDQWPGLIQQLATRPTIARLATEDGSTYAVPLREVTIERYVNRLRLDASIPEPVFKMVQHLPRFEDRPMLKAVARRAVWQSESRREILTRYLASLTAADGYRIEDALELLKLVEAYEPANVGELNARIPLLQQALHHEINLAVNPKPFFNERIEEMHGLGRDQRRQDNSHIVAKERLITSLARLKLVLG